MQTHNQGHGFEAKLVGFLLLWFWIFRVTYFYGETKWMLGVYGSHLNLLFKVSENRIAFRHSNTRFVEKYFRTMGWCMMGSLLSPLVYLTPYNWTALLQRAIYVTFLYAIVNLIPDKHLDKYEANSFNTRYLVRLE